MMMVIIMASKKKEVTRQCMDSTFRNMDDRIIDEDVTCPWLIKGELQDETESMIICTQ
jgi:hypothetical protein